MRLRPDFEKRSRRLAERPRRNPFRPVSVRQAASVCLVVRPECSGWARASNTNLRAIWQLGRQRPQVQDRPIGSLPRVRWRSRRLSGHAATATGRGRSIPISHQERERAPRARSQRARTAQGRRSLMRPWRVVSPRGVSITPLKKVGCAAACEQSVLNDRSSSRIIVR
jgi:hypothetical protein